MVQTEFPELNNLLNLDLEYQLTVGVAIAHNDENCPPYFIRRREVLIPAILKSAAKQGLDPVDHFADYARKVHSKLCESKEGDDGTA